MKKVYKAPEKHVFMNAKTGEIVGKEIEIEIKPSAFPNEKYYGFIPIKESKLKTGELLQKKIIRS